MTGIHAADLGTWDWRRRITALYADIRANPDPSAAWQHWRDTKDALFRTHAQTPIEPGTPFEGLPYFSYDPSLRFLVDLVPVSGPEETLPAGGDGDVRLRPLARTQGLQALGAELTLWWILGYGGGVFLPFADATSGRETYGAGRYLLDTIKGPDLGEIGGRTVLDFNFAYNPSCAYSLRYICPLAPPANRLPSKIEAGERFTLDAGPALA